MSKTKGRTPNEDKQPRDALNNDKIPETWVLCDYTDGYCCVAGTDRNREDRTWFSNHEPLGPGLTSRYLLRILMEGYKWMPNKRTTTDRAEAELHHMGWAALCVLEDRHK